MWRLCLVIIAVDILCTFFCKCVAFTDKFSLYYYIDTSCVSIKWHVDPVLPKSCCAVNPKWLHHSGPLFPVCNNEDLGPDYLQSLCFYHLAFPYIRISQPWHYGHGGPDNFLLCWGGVTGLNIEGCLGASLASTTHRHPPAQLGAWKISLDIAKHPLRVKIIIPDRELLIYS